MELFFALLSPQPYVQHLQIEELKTTPAESSASAPELAAKALDSELNAPGASNTPQAVNDLTSIVKKKKKNAEDTAVKRKADSEMEDATSEKKARIEEAPAS